MKSVQNLSGKEIKNVTAIKGGNNDGTTHFIKRPSGTLAEAGCEVKLK